MAARLAHFPGEQLKLNCPGHSLVWSYRPKDFQNYFLHLILTLVKLVV